MDAEPQLRNTFSLIIRVGLFKGKKAIKIVDKNIVCRIYQVHIYLRTGLRVNTAMRNHNC